MIRFLICNLFHRYAWLGIRDFERLGLKAKKAIHCTICEGEPNRNNKRRGKG